MWSCIPSRLPIPRPFVDTLCTTVVDTFCFVSKTSRLLCTLVKGLVLRCARVGRGVYLILKGGKYSVHVCICLFPRQSVTNFAPKNKEASDPGGRIIYTVSNINRHRTCLKTVNNIHAGLITCMVFKTRIFLFDLCQLIAVIDEKKIRLWIYYEVLKCGEIFS